MRVVIDANVLVSYLLSNSTHFRSRVREILARHCFLYANETMEEVIRVLGRPKLQRYLDHALVQGFLLHLEEFGERVEIASRIVACRDPKDDIILSLAVSGSADCIVTGDEDLLVLNPFAGIPILTVESFLERFPGD